MAVVHKQHFQEASTALSQVSKTARHIGPCQAAKSRKPEMRLTETPAPRIDHSRPAAAFRPLPVSAQWGRACCRGHWTISQSHTPLFSLSPFFILDSLPQPHQPHPFTSAQASTALLPLLLSKEPITATHETASAKVQCLPSLAPKPSSQQWPRVMQVHPEVEDQRPGLSSPGRSNKRSRPEARGSETGALGRRGSRAPIGNNTQDGARRRASGGQPWGLKTSSAADEGLTGGSWVWFVFSVAATWEPWKPGGLRRPGRWPLIPHDGDDARDVGEGGTARLPFCTADSPQVCGRIMPRAAWGWTDRAMQRSFPLPGASRRLRLWAGKRQPRRCPTEVLSVWRARLTPRKGQGNEGQTPEARGQKQETRRGTEEGAEALT